MFDAEHSQPEVPQENAPVVNETMVPRETIENQNSSREPAAEEKISTQPVENATAPELPNGELTEAQLQTVTAHPSAEPVPRNGQNFLARFTRMILPPELALPVPQVSITRAVIQAMTDHVLAYPNRETAWGIYGFRRLSDNMTTICGILLPRQDEDIHYAATTHFGNAFYGNEVRWLEAQYRYLQRKQLAPQDTVLEFLYKGHSHHGLGVQQYSSTDMASLRDAVRLGMPVAIGPLANITRASSPRISRHDSLGVLRVTNSQQVQFRFYLHCQAFVQCGYDLPVEIIPNVCETADPKIPIPPLPWIYTNPDHYEAEISELTQNGCSVSQRWILPLKVQVIVKNPSWQRVLLITTPHNYPASYAVVTTAVLGENNAFEDEQSIFSEDEKNKGVTIRFTSFLDLAHQLIAKGIL